MKNIIQSIKDLIAIYKAIVELRAILESVAPELKADVKKLAEDIDSVIAKVQASPNELDDKIVPLLSQISAWLKKVSA